MRQFPTSRAGTCRPQGDDGVVLLAVVAALTVLTLFLLATLAYVLQNAPLGRRDQDAKIAIGAAEAGLEDYVSRLNSNADYWRKGNADPGNPALNTASGRMIQGTANAGARYRYRVLSGTDETARTGIVRLEVTGTSSPDPSRPAVSRVLTATVKPRTFLDFAYLSDIEVMDPELVGSDGACANYRYGPSSRDGHDCAPIIWKSGDKVDGPLHSNDALTIDSPVDFRNPRTESSWPDIAGAAPSAKTWMGSATAVAGFKPVYAPGLPLPAGNEELVHYVEPDVDGDGDVGPGCYYTGATRIVLQGTNMRVYSPGTTSGATPDRCFSVGSRANVQVKPIPPVIYVDETAASCTAGAIGYPVNGEVVPSGGAGDSSWGKTTNYDCHRGSVYVEGRADAQVTIAATHDVVVTGDLTLARGSAGDDLVGLIAGNYVWVHHPVDASGNTLSSARPVTTIQAAILSLRHSFVVQNWDSGDLIGSLNVLGSIGQRFRGPVGATHPDTGRESGYLKNYQYDGRFRTTQPPYFLKPASNLWHVLTVTDK